LLKEVKEEKKESRIESVVQNITWIFLIIA